MKSITLRQWEATAYAAGTLTQLRRVCKPQPVDAPSFVHYGTKSIVKEVASGQIFTTEQCIAALVQFAPYGSPGDALALRGLSLWNTVIQSVRLERVQDMSEADARACGISDGGCLNCGVPEPCGCESSKPDARDGYIWHFHKDNPRTPWESNPWCWVIDVENNCPVHGRGDKA